MLLWVTHHIADSYQGKIFFLTATWLIKKNITYSEGAECVSFPISHSALKRATRERHSAPTLDW